MKLIFLMIIAVSSAVTSSVFAADLSPRAPPPVFVPPPFTWTGFYVGAEVGYAWGQDNINGYPYDYRAWGLTSVDSVGVLGGAHIGYNYQVNQFLYGIEGDVDGSQFQKSTYGAFGNNYDTRVSIQGSIRGRFGL
jgi:outer membrane immunogenic protein